MRPPQLRTQERTQGANLGLYSVTFNNDLERDKETLEHFHSFRREAERKGFRYFLEVFDPNVPSAVLTDLLPHYINDMITRMLAGVSPAGRPIFLKIAYHGPKAMEELVRFDPQLIVGILGGSSGTTRDAFQLLADAQKYGERVALFGRKINHAENQLAFVQFLRLIVDGHIGPVDAVKAYHAVLGKLGVRPQRPLEDDLRISEQAMSYAGGPSVVVPAPEPPREQPRTLPLTKSHHACSCQGSGASCACPAPATRVTESIAVPHARGQAPPSNGRPDFATMSPADRLNYHRHRLGLGL